jgi:hypothetical protein
MNLPNLAGRVGLRGFFSLTAGLASDLVLTLTLEEAELATGVDIFKITSGLVWGIYQFYCSVKIFQFFMSNPGMWINFLFPLLFLGGVYKNI